MGYRDWLDNRYNRSEAAAMDAALDVALHFLRMDAVAMDDAPMSLEAHDRRYHPDGWKHGDRCEFRETLEKSDSVDDLMTAERREDSRTAGGAQGDYLSRKKRDEYRRLMAKKLPDVDADEVLSELAKIEDKRVQGDAFQWLMRKKVRLPEDLYKVEQARELATKAKRNPLDWDTPQACINELTGQGHKISEKPITVEELKQNPLMSDYRDEGYGVETFQVEDSWQGQALMRRVIDTHWGKDANPWCLLARTEDNEGEEDEEDYYLENAPSHNKADSSLRNAWNYWQHYNALPKRVAFKDGKLLAFMATDTDEDPEDYDSYYERMEREGRQPLSLEDWQLDFNARRDIPEQWWDRQDESHAGIPVGQIPVPGDPHGRWATMELEAGKGLVRKGAYEKGIGGKNGYMLWDEKDGHKVQEKTDGRSVFWSAEDVPHEIRSDKVAVTYDDEGRIKRVGNVKKSEANIPLRIELKPDGAVREISAYLDPENTHEMVRMRLSPDGEVTESKRCTSYGEVIGDANLSSQEVARIKRDVAIVIADAKAEEEWLKRRYPATKIQS